MATRNIIDLNTTNPGISASPTTITPAGVLGKAVIPSTTKDIPVLQSVNNNYPKVPAFGSNHNPIGSYPNDVVRLDVANAVKQYLESNYRVTSFSKNNDQITLSPEQDLADMGYLSGQYTLTYKFHRNLLGSGDVQKVQIQEISSDGLELRVIPALSKDYDNTSFLNFFQEGFFNIPKAQTLVNLYLFKDAQTAMQVYDYVQDKFTYPTTPYSIIFKLNTPVPNGVIVGDLIWLSQQVSSDVVDTVQVTPLKTQSDKIVIAGPDWDALTHKSTGISTQYKDWDDLLTTNQQTTNNIVNSMLSGSSLEGIQLNIDYRVFDNFIQFGSAAERLQNFKYKLQLLESYDARIAQLSSSLAGLPSSSVTSSTYFQNNVFDAQNKKAALLGAFDGYENYLYYQSSSYVTNSFGEFYPSTWPKVNNTYPYINYSTTSSQALSWYNGVLSTASLYDYNNTRALTKVIPAHIVEDPSNDQFTLFVNMIGHYYDIVLEYIKSMTDIQNRQQSLYEGFSKELVYHIAKNLGLDLENGGSLEDLWSYALGTDPTGSLSSQFDPTHNFTTENRTKEIWKRLVNNLPYLLKSKGTERGIKALLTCFGIPQTILRIREYGGTEPEFTTTSKLKVERFNYGLNIGVPSGSTNYHSSIKAPWGNLNAFYSGTTYFPQTVELRAKLAPNLTGSRTLMSAYTNNLGILKWYIQAFKSGSGNYLGFYINSGSTGPYASVNVSCSVYDGNWHQIALRQEVVGNTTSSINQYYTLIVKGQNYDKVTTSISASLYVDGLLSSSYNQSYTAASELWISGHPTGSTAWSGSVQELRYWNVALQDNTLNNHTLNPTSYQSNQEGPYMGSTGSYYDLAFRLPLGSDNKKTNVYTSSSILSAHPNQSVGSFLNYASSGSAYYYTTNNQYTPVDEFHSIEWPDLGGNRSLGEKIRIDNTTIPGNQLYLGNSVEKAVSDNQPVDSPRLGIFLSPTNEVNKDIAEQFGGISIDDYIGNPADLTKDNYPDLESLQREYFKKYAKIGRSQNYIRILQHFDAALFKMIKASVPSRAQAQVGLVIEPHLLHRNKIAVKQPSFTENQYSASIDISPEAFIKVGGNIEDGGGDPKHSSNYVTEGTVDGVGSYYLDFEGTNITELEGIFSEELTRISGDQPSTTLVPRLSYTQGTGDLRADEITGDIDLGVSSYGRDVRVKGSQYSFVTYARSGSGASISQPYIISSSRYDYTEVLNPVILDSARSQVANVGSVLYNEDVFGLQAFPHNSPLTIVPDYRFTSSNALYSSPWTSQYGLTIVSTYTGSTLLSTPLTGSVYWGIDYANGLYFNASSSANCTYTASIQIPAFFYDNNDPISKDYLYDITVFTVTNVAYSRVTGSLELHYGNLDCGSTGSITQLETVGGDFQITTFSNVKALGNWLGLRLYMKTPLVPIVPYELVYIRSLQVRCKNYRARVQDFHLQDSYGMRSARYDGCKLVSADWNVDSPDTIDNGPVVTVLVGGGKQLNTNPGVRGNFKVS